MPTPPIPVPSGQTVVWIAAGAWSATAVGQPGHGTAAATATTGNMTQNAGSPIAPPTETCTWSDYAVPSILTRPGAVIYGIYPVAEYNGFNVHTDLALSLNGVPISGPPWNSGSGSFNSTNYSSLGTNLSSIPGIVNSSQMTQTAPGGYPTDSLNFTYVGIAVYTNKVPIPSVFVSVGNGIHTNVGPQ